MKKIVLLFLIFSAFLHIGCSSPRNKPINNNTEDTVFDIPSTETEENNMINEPKRTVLNYNNIKAIWLSQFDLQNIYTNEKKQREKSDFTSKIKTVLTNVKSNGFNTIIVQVRPYADSFYPSEYYPPSRYVTGDYSNSFQYDAIEIIIKEAHRLELSVQAWINPLRGMTTDEIKFINDKYLIKQWYGDNQKNGSYLVEYNGRYYLNPAYSDVRQLIINGVSEIVQKYTFDGVHMDDYFYPTTAENFDSLAFSEYKLNGGNGSLKQFRYDSLNTLIAGIYSAVKNENDALIYGISPEGNMTNATDKSYADVYTWCSEDGYIDYICPQIYFGFEHQTCAFDLTAQKWENIIKNDNVKLIIGMTLGKAYSKTDKWAGIGKNEWSNNSDVLKRCLEYTVNLKKCSGAAYFCYQYFYIPETATEVTETKAERENFLPVLKDISWIQ